MRDFFYHLLAICTVAIWGVTFVNTKVLLLHGLTPLEIFIIRFFIAYCCTLLISHKKLLADSWKDEGACLLLGFVGGTLYFMTENTALKLSLVNNVAFIVCTAPLLTIFLALFFVKGVKLSWQLIIGSLLAMTGVALVIYNGQFHFKLNPLGDILALGAALSWAIYSLIIKSLSSRYPALFITRKVFFYGLITALFFLIPYPWEFPLESLRQPVVWMNLLFLSIVASFICFFTWNFAVTKIGALKTSNYVYLNPITTLIASSIILHEPMTVMSITGSFLILIGLAIVNRLDI